MAINAVGTSATLVMDWGRHSEEIDGNNAEFTSAFKTLARDWGRHNDNPTPDWGRHHFAVLKGHTSSFDWGRHNGGPIAPDWGRRV